MKGDIWDPKGLIAEAFRIENITEPECRAIFLDWALSLPPDCDTQAALKMLLQRAPDPGHPMTAILRAGQHGMTPQGRRGGARARNRAS